MPSEINESKDKRVSVVVLGDFGRSPRMQYHALSLSQNNYQVDVVAYKGVEPLEQITRNNSIHLHYMKDVPNFLSNELSDNRFSETYAVCAEDTVAKFLPFPDTNKHSKNGYHSSADFHNYGYTILALNSSRQSLLVRIAEWCEKYFSPMAHKSICVTKAMKDDLSQNWNVRASVFYDCAPDIFHPISLEEKHNFFMKMSQEYTQFNSKSETLDECTRFTKKVGEEYEMVSDRPALIVSGTSWTEDEDFSILLSALEDYEQKAKLKSDLPDLLVAITGKGPLKSYYENLIKDKEFFHVEILTLWLKFEDYPLILACADLGISLHNSSSGLDLPMKVVDMFGCCLPVAAISFNCIDELVKDGVNGTIFTDSQQLSRKLQRLFNGFPKKRTDLSTFRENLERTSSLRWEENWNHTVAPLLRELYATRTVSNMH